MKSRANKNYFFGWVPHFAAQVMEQSEAGLRGRAFAVCERGRIVAASDEALQAGARAGMTSGRAQGSLASLMLVARERGREALAWNEIQRAFYGLTPLVEPMEPGLLFAQIAPERIAPLLQNWKMRGGVAADRATAQMAALGAPIGRVHLVDARDERAFADSYRLKHLGAAGIETKTLQRLEWFGWHNVGQLRPLSRRQLEEQVGADGAALYAFAQGSRERANLRSVATWTPPLELVAALSFELPAREPSHWDGALDALLCDICGQLNGRSAQTLEVTARTAVAPVCARRVLKEPLAAPGKLRRPLENALLEALETLAPFPPVVSAIEVRLGALVCPPDQIELFDGSARDERGTQPRRLGAALAGLETRFAGRVGTFAPAQTDSPFPEDGFAWLPALEKIARARDNKTKKAVR